MPSPDHVTLGQPVVPTKIPQSPAKALPGRWLYTPSDLVQPVLQLIHARYERTFTNSFNAWISSFGEVVGESRDDEFCNAKSIAARRLCYTRHLPQLLDYAMVMMVGWERETAEVLALKLIEKTLKRQYRRGVRAALKHFPIRSSVRAQDVPQLDNKDYTAWMLAFAGAANFPKQALAEVQEYWWAEWTEVFHGVWVKMCETRETKKRREINKRFILRQNRRKPQGEPGMSPRPFHAAPVVIKPKNLRKPVKQRIDRAPRRLKIFRARRFR